MQERLDSALERNNNLAVFRQASMMATTKLREKEAEVERLTEEKNKIIRQTEEKEAQLEAQGKNKGPKRDLKKYGAQVSLIIITIIIIVIIINGIILIYFFR